MTTFSESQPSYDFSRWLFTRALGAIYLIAFVSIWTQITGLVGRGGILPANVFLTSVREVIGPERYFLLPTIFWIDASNATIHTVCAAGVILSCVILLGWVSTPALFLLWFFYLSLVGICQDFLAFQWDILLLEAGFLAIFLNPPELFARDQRNSPHTREFLWLLWWLLFRLMFSSGAVKLSNGDFAWRDLTALNYHYQTQPLPTWIGWYAHQLPPWFDKFSTLLMFGIELLLPFLIFIRKKGRLVAGAGIVFLQFLILITGNYAFFNLLTVALCLLLVKEEYWPERWLLKTSLTDSRRRWPRVMVYPLSIFLALLSVIPLTHAFRFRIAWPDPVLRLYSYVQPFSVVNGYGLFAVMTKSREEIILEGSNDGLQWSAYEFKYKPGDPKQRPAFVAPHQPRLDWQMWFAALETYQGNRWYIPFCYRLLDGSPDVLSLLDKNPFPDKPPRFLRSRLFDYRFTNIATKRRDKLWWERTYKGEYCPTLTK